MSHAVIVTRTTTTATTSAILLNVGYFKKPPGILKLFHVVLGVVTVGILGHNISGFYGSNSFYYGYLFVPELFFLLIATTCLIASTLLVVACFISIASATILPKTVFEILFHGFATIFLLIAAAIYTAKIHHDYLKNSSTYTSRLAASEIVHFPPLSFLLLISSVYCLGKVIVRNAMYVTENMVAEPGYGAKIFASIIGMINSILYAVASYFAYKAYKSG